MTEITTQKTLPLAWAAKLVSDLCSQIDESPVLSLNLRTAFRDATLELSEAIDRRKATMYALAGSLEMARGARDDLDAYIQRLKLIEASIKTETKEAMEANPNLPWKDSFGRKLSLVKNVPSLKLVFDLKESRTFTNLVHEDTIKMFEIPPKFLKGAFVTILDTDALKRALAEGEVYGWAELEHKKHVRGLAPKKEEVTHG